MVYVSSVLSSRKDGLQRTEAERKKIRVVSLRLGITQSITEAHGPSDIHIHSV